MTDSKKVIIWAKGKTGDAIEMTVAEGRGIDVEAAATALGCEYDDVRQCSPGEMDAYGVSLKDDIFQRPQGLADESTTGKFLVSWIESENLGIYEAENADAAILVAVQDAGYASLEAAAAFVRDGAGELTLQAIPITTADEYIGGRFQCVPEDQFHADGVVFEVVGDDGEYTTFEFEDGSSVKINADGEIFAA